MAIAPLSQTQIPTETTDTESAGPLVKAAASKNMPGIVGNIPLNATQTEELLKNMQQVLDQKTGFFSQLNSGLADISAWGSGGKEGPTQALALRAAERRKDEEGIQKLRMDMAMTQAAAAQQANAGKSLDKMLSGGAGTGKGTFSIVDPEVMGEVKRLKDLNRFAEAEKFYQESLKKAAEVYASPGMDKPEIPQLVFDPETNTWVTKLVSAREYRQNLANGTGEETPESIAAMKAAVKAKKEMPDSEMLPALTKAVYSQESGSGKADTSKPNYAGAIGPMQILQTTFDDLKKRNLIPQDYDINNEAHNKQAGFALLSDYAKKYNNDPDKILAAYYGGPGAVNSDGTINRDWKDKKNDKAPTVGQYIDQVKARINLTNQPSAPRAMTVSAEAPGRPPKPVSAQQLQREEEANLAYQKETGKVTAETWKKPTENFLANTEQGVVRKQVNLSNRLGNLIETYKDDPNVVGLLNDKGMANALATIARDGIQTPLGSLALSKLEDAYQKVIPGVGKEQILARQEIGQILAEYAQEASRSSSGQGSVSDFERSMFQQIAGSTSNSPELLKKVQQTMLAKAEFAKQSRDLYNQGMQANKGRPYNFGDFQATKEYANLVDNYFNKLESIGGPLKKTASPQQKPETSPFAYQDADKEKRYQLFKQQNGPK